MFQRGVFALLGGLEEPLNLFESAVRGVGNIGSDASAAGQSFAAASLATNSDDRLSFIGQGLGNIGQALLNSTGVAGLVDSVAESLLLRDTFGAGGEVVANSLPAGVTYEGPLYRAVPAGGDALDISYSVNASGRYTVPGQGGLYFASNAGTVEAEFVNNGSSLVGRDLNAFPDSSVNNLLDLTDPVVRERLGVSLEDLTRTGGTPAWRYEVTQPLGKFAQSQGYNGILAPSAQADGGVNLILFSSKGVK